MKLTYFFTVVFSSLLTLESFAKSEFKENKYLFDMMNKDFVSFSLKLVPKNIKLNFNSNWEINYPAASAERDSDFPTYKPGSIVGWDISVLSGYWRDEEFGHPMVHLLVLCHELGHHIGGAPYKFDDKGNIRWASMEPQADYYATKECIPKFLKSYPYWTETKIISSSKVDPEITHQCEVQFTDKNKSESCKWISEGALYLARIHQKFEYPKPQNQIQVSPNTPDKKIVKTLDRDAYPSDQCRFDTHFNGALGLGRPSCWFINE